MPGCAFIKCHNHSRTKNKTNDITFHSFPKDELNKQKWLVVVRKQRQEPYWAPTIYSRVCSIHFKPEDTYTTSKGLKRISTGAVPFFRAPMKLYDYTSEPSSPNSLQNVDVSDTDSVFDTPQEQFLKSKIIKTTLDKNKLRKENKIMKRRIQRLEEQCKSLKDTIMNLKKELKEKDTTVILNIMPMNEK